MRYALVNGLVYNRNTRELSKNDVLIEDGRIAGIGEFKQGTTKYDFSGKLLLPGLINVHAHLGETIFKGLLGRMPLHEYIAKTEQINDRMTGVREEMRAASSYMTLLTMLDFGVTTLCAGRCQEECDRAGIRSFSGYMLMKTKKLEAFTSSFNEYFSTYSQGIKKSKLSNSLVFLHSLAYCNEKMLEKASQLVNKHKIKFTAHVAETEREEKAIREKYGETSVELLDRHGLVGRNSLLVHCCNISHEDANIIKRRGAHVVICPTSNINLGNMLPDVMGLMQRGVNISIATDGLATGSAGNLFSECLELKREFGIGDDALFDMITSNPAKALSIEAGSIERGLFADISIFKMAKNAFRNAEGVALEKLNSLDADSVIVGGNFVLKDSKPLNLNKKNVKVEYRKMQTLMKNTI